jgi:hypothetical protein
VSKINKGLDKLRQQQAARVMPIVGGLLDAWEGTENDEKAALEQDFPHLCELLRALNNAVEHG